MRIVAITRVKNEQDIIEAFVRHTVAHCSELIVIDHTSNDATYAILQNLEAEGLPVVVRRTATLQTQGSVMTDLMREAFTQRGADWVVPLDADEFIETPNNTLLCNCLPSSDRIQAIHWNNFICRPESSTGQGDNPVVTLRWATKAESNLHKVIVPRSVGQNRHAAIYEGNHAVVMKGVWQPVELNEKIVLCHYPVRSVAQYALKVTIGTWRYLMHPAQDGNIWGWHYKEAYQALLEGDWSSFAVQMYEDSRKYSADTTCTEPNERAMRYLGGELRYPIASTSEHALLAGILLYGEMIARDHANLLAA